VWILPDCHGIVALLVISGKQPSSELLHTLRFICVCWPPKRQCSISTTSSPQHGSTSCLPGNFLARVTISTNVDDTASSHRARVSHNIHNRLESLDCVWVEACGDCAFCCRRVLWRAHTSSPRGATTVGVSFLLEVTLSQPALLIGPGLITWALGCTFGTQLSV